jgi:hypothetical protein
VSNADASRLSGRKGAFLRVREGELRRLFRFRYGPILPDDDAGRDDLQLVLSHTIERQDGRRRSRNFIETTAPWFPVGEIESLLDFLEANPVRYDAGQLSQRVGLTDDERTELRIRTVAPIDLSEADLKERRLAKKRASQKALRERKKRERAAGGSSLSERATIVLASLRRLARWCGVPEIAEHVASDPAYKINGKSAAGETLRRAINRAIAELLAAGAVQERRFTTRRGLIAREVLALPVTANIAPRDFVSGTAVALPK